MDVTSLVKRVDRFATEGFEGNRLAQKGRSSQDSFHFESKLGETRKVQTERIRASEQSENGGKETLLPQFEAFDTNQVCYS